MKLRKILFLFAWILLFPQLYSHPHLFITPVVELLTSSSTLRGLNVKWTWDEFWSQDVLDFCDQNMDGVFSAEETEIVFDDFFVGIKDFDFFTQIYVNNQRIPIPQVTHFKVYARDNIVTYLFYIPVNQTISGTGDVKIIFNDETIYTAFDEKFLVRAKSGNIQNLMIAPFKFYGVEAIFQLSP
ncbi:MAG: DUF1007 family protein [Spirochaetes bacterium]|nr:DUF1007 family protein [Spirochaetota bacterium]